MFLLFTWFVSLSTYQVKFVYKDDHKGTMGLSYYCGCTFSVSFNFSSALYWLRDGVWGEIRLMTFILYAAAPISVTLVNSIFQYELNSALLTGCAGISEASKRSLCMVLLVIVNYDFLNKLLMSVGSKNDENKKVFKKRKKKTFLNFPKYKKFLMTLNWRMSISFL